MLSTVKVAPNDDDEEGDLEGSESELTDPVADV